MEKVKPLLIKSDLYCNYSGLLSTTCARQAIAPTMDGLHRLIFRSMVVAMACPRPVTLLKSYESWLLAFLLSRANENFVDIDMQGLRDCEHNSCCDILTLQWP